MITNNLPTNFLELMPVIKKALVQARSAAQLSDPTKHQQTKNLQPSMNIQ
jgi:hypothetical protein